MSLQNTEIPKKQNYLFPRILPWKFFFIGFSCVCRQQKLLQKFPRLKRNLRKRKKNTTTSVYYYASSVYLAKGQQCRDASALWILFTHIYAMGGGEGRGHDDPTLLFQTGLTSITAHVYQLSEVTCLL